MAKHYTLLAIMLLLGIMPMAAQQMAAFDTTAYLRFNNAPDYFKHLYAREHDSLLPPVKIIRHVNVLHHKSKRKWKRFRTVIVRGDSIWKMRSSIFPTRKKDRAVVTAGHQYLIPGMIDMHMHHMCTDERLELLYLFNGITAAREMNGWVDRVEQRRLIRGNILLWPDYFVAKSTFDSINTDLVKTHDGPYFFNLTTILQQQECDFHLIGNQLSTAMLDSSVALAERYGKPIVLKMNVRRPLTGSLASPNIYTADKLDGFMGCSGLMPIATEDDYDLLVQRGIAFVPCISNFPMDFTTYATKFLTAPENPYITEVEREEWTNFYMNPAGVRDSLYGQITNRREQNNAITREFLKRGGTVLVGTETGPGHLPLNVAGFAFHNELEELQAVGMTPRQLLDAATRDAAATLKVSDRIGTVRKHHRADMVLLTANPLADIRATREVTGLMLRGIWFDRQELTEMKKVAIKLR